MGQDKAPPRWVQEKEQEQRSTYLRRTRMWKQQSENEWNGVAPSPAVRARNVLQALARDRFLLLHRAERLHATKLLAAVTALGNVRLLLDIQEREPVREPAVSVWSKDLKKTDGIHPCG
jgi:hypothetical protein